MGRLPSLLLAGTLLGSGEATAATPWSLGIEAGALFASSPHGLGGALGLELGPSFGRLSPSLGLDLATTAGTGEVTVPGHDGKGTWRLRTSWLAPTLGARFALLDREEPTVPEVDLGLGLCFAATTSRTDAAGVEGPLAVDSATVPCGSLGLGLFRMSAGSDLGARLGVDLLPLESPLMTGSFRVIPTLDLVYRRRSS